MINDIINYLNNLEDRFINNHIDSILAYSIYLKYLCDYNKLDYDYILKNDDTYQFLYGTKLISKILIKKNISINKIVYKYKDTDISGLVNDFINLEKKDLEFHNNKDKILYIGYDKTNYSIYNIYGNATYTYNNENNELIYDLFKAFDEILGVNNKYFFEDDINVEDYNYIYINDNTPTYRYNDKRIYEKIHMYIKYDKNVILKTKYSIISNFKYGRILVNYLKTIILEDNNATIIFDHNNQDKEISIINYDKSIIKDNESLYKIINDNKKRKNILVKTNKDEIINNNMRIGFKLYQLEKENIIKDINNIVDENTRYLERLNYININVEKEINKLLNK